MNHDDMLLTMQNNYHPSGRLRGARAFSIFPYIGIVLAICMFMGCGPKKESMVADGTLQFTGRSMVPAGEGWEAENNKIAWKPEETAMIICDMWDNHWCRGMTSRVAEMPPFVSHAEGTQLVVEQIEKYWCPSVLSKDLAQNWK